MSDTQISSDRSGVTALVDLVASAQEEGALVVSSARLIDALLDARPELNGSAVDAVDRGLVGCTHRTVVTTEEALALVAEVFSASRVVEV